MADFPEIKRYALVPNDSNNGMRRFHLARVAPSSRSALRGHRLERMEEVAAREGSDPLSPFDSRGLTP